MQIVGVTGSAPRGCVDNHDLINVAWERGKRPDISREVQLFQDADCATVARLAVQNPEGLPARHIREFIFANNRFLASRETAVLKDGFEARPSTVDVGAKAVYRAGEIVATTGASGITVPPDTVETRDLRD